VAKKNEPKRITLENKEDAKELFTSYLEIKNHETFYSACKNSFCPDLLQDEWVTDMFSRYNYCEKFNTPAYPGAYDDQPAGWMDFRRILESGINSVKSCTCQKHKPNG